MKTILTAFSLVALLMLTTSVHAQRGRSYVTGYFALDLDGAKQGVIAPIDNKGNATFLNVAPGKHSVALLLPAVQKVREAAANRAYIEVVSWWWGVSSSAPSIVGHTTVSNPSWTSMKPTTLPLKEIIKHKGEEYYKIELENILVSSYQQSGGTSGGDKPQESLSLNFTKIEYNIKENKK